MNYYTDPDPGSRNFPYGSKSGSRLGNSSYRYGSKVVQNPIFFHKILVKKSLLNFKCHAIKIYLPVPSYV